MEPVKKQNNIGAGFAAVGVVLAAAIGVFASTFNPPVQPVAPTPDATNAPNSPAAVTPTQTAVAATPTPNPDAIATSTSQPVTVTTPKTVVPTPIPTPVVASSVYRNGTYSATGSYNSPGGEDQVAVTLTLNNDIVTSVTATPQSQDRTSARYQAMFVSGYKQYVVGKDISSVHVGRVSGSSLTGIGFNAAIAKIEVEAKA